MQKEIVFGWGVAFQYTRSLFEEAMWNMEGLARKERWNDEKYEVECSKIASLNLDKTPRKRVFDEPYSQRRLWRPIFLTLL